MVLLPPPPPPPLVVRLKVAVALCTAFIVTVQLDVPVQSPDQPPNIEPELAVAERVTEVAAS